MPMALSCHAVGCSCSPEEAHSDLCANSNEVQQTRRMAGARASGDAAAQLVAALAGQPQVGPLGDSGDQRRDASPSDENITARSDSADTGTGAEGADADDQCMDGLEMDVSSTTVTSVPEPGGGGRSVASRTQSQAQKRAMAADLVKTAY